MIPTLREHINRHINGGRLDPRLLPVCVTDRIGQTQLDWPVLPKDELLIDCLAASAVYRNACSTNVGECRMLAKTAVAHVTEVYRERFDRETGPVETSRLCDICGQYLYNLITESRTY